MERPIITTDKRLAMQKHIIAEKELNDTTYYYYTESTFNQTTDYEQARKGYIIVIKTLKNGKPIGMQTYLDGFGDTLFVDYYDINNLDSLHISYYGNKQIKFYHEFKNGKKYGVSKSFYQNGNIQQEKYWQDGYLHGEEINNYENGQLKSKGNNKNGIKSGLWFYFNEQGDTIKTENY
jgi:antitoxin component YwqK of YwqJK toxin-antitoxin module